jgi:membrane protein YdbS with pleckstrin-like domain
VLAGRVGDVSDALFDPPGTSWTRVSPALTTVRRILLVPPLLVAAVTLVVVAVLWTDGPWSALLLALAVVALGAAGWAWRWAARNTASWGYAEQEEDLLVTGGVLVRRLVAVPYGRMQFVEVQAGPVDRRFGIATVTLHTASTETAADIPGLPADEARRLRNRLTELGESHGAGL